MKGAGRMLGRSYAGAKKTASVYGVGKAFRKGKKGIYKKAGVSEGAGDVLTKGAAAIGVGVMAVSAIPTLIVGGAVGGGAYLVGQTHAPTRPTKLSAASLAPLEQRAAQREASIQGRAVV